MGNYLAQGINQGFALGADAAQRRKDRERREKELDRDIELRRELAQKRLDFQMEREKERKAGIQVQLDVDGKRRLEDLARTEADPVYRLQRAKAQLELDQLGKPPPASPAMAKVSRNLPGGATASYDMPLTDLERSFGPAQPPPAEPLAPPTAKITQAFGEGGRSKMQFDAPLSEAKQMTGAASYKSPYAEEIAGLSSQIAEHQSEIEGGDTRFGFLGVGSSRKDAIETAKRKERRLRALELKDMFDKGIIDEEEADRRAARI